MIHGRSSGSRLRAVLGVIWAGKGGLEAMIYGGTKRAYKASLGQLVASFRREEGSLLPLGNRAHSVVAGS